MLMIESDCVKTQIFMFGGETGLSPSGWLRSGLDSDWWRDEKNRLQYCIIFSSDQKMFLYFFVWYI